MNSRFLVRLAAQLLILPLFGCGHTMHSIFSRESPVPRRDESVIANGLQKEIGLGESPHPGLNESARNKKLVLDEQSATRTKYLLDDESWAIAGVSQKEIECGNSPSHMDDESRAIAIESLKQIEKKGQDYLVGPEDLLEISIFEWELREETKTSAFRVSETGYISLPVIGLVYVGGSTVANVRNKIEDTFRSGGFIPDPRISVDIKEFRSNKVSVVGAVRNPGTYTLRQNATTILDILALAGGVSEKAGYLANVIRPANVAAGKRASITIDLYELVIEGNLSINMVLSRGDVVNVPEAETYSVMGSVQKPGNYPMKRPITVMEGIAEAGGPMEKETAPGEVLLHRKMSTGESVLFLDLEAIMKGQKKNCYLQPRDVIEVPEARTYSVIGFVNRPGNYFLKRSTTALDGLAEAGGLIGKEASPREAILHRNLRTGETVIIPVDVEGIIRGDSENFHLRPGDVIEVPTVTYTVTGFVQKPGNFPIKRPTTVMEGIAEAGGLINKEAAAGGVILRRKTKTGETVITIDLVAIVKGEAQNFFLQSGDMIEVPEDKFKRFVNRFVDVIANLFTFSYSLNK